MATKAKFYVYWNLHRNCFSVKHKGKVTAHFTHAFLAGCEFKVSQAGRQRVLREKRKNVHAYIACSTFFTFEEDSNVGKRVTYNPYKHDSFVIAETEQPVKNSRFVSVSVVNGRPVILADGIQEDCPHYIDNQGYCHSCGLLMDPNAHLFS